MKSRIVIYGAGMAGAILARRLADDFDVTVVTPTDYFEAPMATPRLMAQPTLADKAIISIGDAVPKAWHVHGRLVELSEAGGLVDRYDGHVRMVKADITVLATGSRFAAGLVRPQSGSIETRKAMFHQLHASLSAARRILIVGGGPSGVEMAAEIVETWPGASVTIVEAGPRILAGTAKSASAYASSFLQKRGVTLLTEERIESPSPGEGVSTEPGEASTASGKQIAYDVVLWCIGGRPNTDYLRGHYANLLDADGRVKVTSRLLVEGQDRIFALGDVTNLRENKLALHVKGQVRVAEANIRAVALGRAPSKTYQAKTGNPMMAISLGSRAGVTFIPLIGAIRSAWLNRRVKSEAALAPMSRRQLGLPV